MAPVRQAVWYVFFSFFANVAAELFCINFISHGCAIAAEGGRAALPGAPGARACRPDAHPAETGIFD